jgi:hypothetical protein
MAAKEKSPSPDKLLEGIDTMLAAMEQRYDPSKFICPICGAEQSEWDISCGCFEDLHYGGH